MNKAAFGMVCLGATMILSIFAAALSIILWVLNALPLTIAFLTLLFAISINIVGALIDRRLNKRYEKT